MKITQQISNKLLRMDVLTFETCRALNKEIKKHVTSSWSIFIQLVILVCWSNETPTWCDTVQVLFLQGHSTCFGRKRPSSGVFKTSTAATGTCVIFAGKSSHLLNRACRNKTCTVSHQVGVSFDLYYDARKHKIKKKNLMCWLEVFFMWNSGLKLPFASFDYMRSDVRCARVGATREAVLGCINFFVFVFVFLIGHIICKHLRIACHVSLPNFPQ